MAGVPLEIAAADPRVVQPRDLRDRYARPAKELARLAEAGVLLRLAHGYYAVVPEQYRQTGWRPSIEAVGLGVGLSDYARDDVAAMGPSAARLLGAVPRALGMAVIVVPKQRPQLETVVGPVRFVAGEAARLDVQRAETELATGWVTTAEQTVLDLAHRVGLGGLTAAETTRVLRELAGELDWPDLSV